MPPAVALSIVSRPRHRTRVTGASVCWLLALVAVLGTQVPTQAQVAQQTVTGWLSVVWADGQVAEPGQDPARNPARPEFVALLADDRGGVTRLDIPVSLAQSLGGLRRLDRRRVEVTLPASAAAALPAGATARVARPASLRALSSTAGVAPAGALADVPLDAQASISGSHPWVTIACKFPDVAAEPRTLSFFSGMYASTAPGLDHYWREQSYDTANVAGSQAFGWFVLPRVRSFYIYDQDGDGYVDADLDRLFDDCTGAATSSVNFGSFQGVNMMFNSDLDGPAWGGSLYATLDGVSRVWPVTWEPPWAYADISVIAHEMGHGFGLPHSSYGTSNAYDNAWDVMSKDRYGCPPEDATYGCTGQHTIAYHKDLLGWIPSARKVAVPFGGSATVTLERLAQPSTTDTRLVTVSAGTSDGKFFTVETRRRIGYDTKVPGDAVVIHEVVPNRSDDRPAHVVDIDGLPTSDGGAMWTVGETFTDPSGVRISVTGSTATGYTVQIGGATTPPTLSGLSPSTGAMAGGTTVTLTGSGFVDQQTTVRFGGSSAVQVTVASATSLTAVTPVSASSGPVDVTVQTPNGQASLSQAFTYALAPSITTLSPGSVPAYMQSPISVTGTSFVTGGTTASFVSGATPPVTTSAVVSGVTPTSLTVTAPWLTPGTYTLQISTAGGTATRSVVVYGMPSISQIAPAFGPVAGGTVVTITGAQFVAGATTVTVAGAPVAATVQSATQLTLTMPAGAEGYAAVRVTTPAGYSEHTNGFEYLGVPVLSSVTPATGSTAGATRITLDGLRFHARVGAPIVVRVGGLPATDLLNYGPTMISVLTPAGLAGLADVSVTTAGGVATLPAFTYIAPATVSSVLPARGPAPIATTLTITGTGFIPGDTIVQFGEGTTPYYGAQSVVVDSPTTLRVTTPAGMPPMTYALFVTTTGGRTIAPGAYTAVSPPQIATVAPASGLPAGGTLVAVIGANFVAGDVRVTIGGIDATSVVVVSPSSVEARTPASAAGVRDVVVTTSGGSATLAGGFVYTETPTLVPPAVTSVAPSLGPARGGTIVTLRGSAFQPGAVVTIGGIAATAVSYVSTSVLSVTAPPLAAGRHDVRVSTPDGSGTLAGAFETIGPWTGYFAEGATSSVFDTRLALMNPNPIPANVDLRFLATDGAVRTYSVIVGARARATLDVKTVPGMSVAEFSTTIASDIPVVADRTMTWDASRRYGAHAETAIPSPSPTWYLAEGATHSGFDLFYLLQNPGSTETTVRVRYLRPSGEPLEKTYRLAPTSRTNIWVNVEEFDGAGRALASTDVSAVIESLDATPIIVERALYLTRSGRLFDAGHESAGVTTPRTQWFLAEGATGAYFDLFVLIANPNAQAADVRVTYLLTDGRTFTRTISAPPNSRSNIWVDQEQFTGVEGYPLADVAVSTTVESTNGVPLIVERSLWWPGGFSEWSEAHNSAGAWQTGTAWGLAEGEEGGPSGEETFVLIANTSAFAGSARVTLLFEDGSASVRTYTLAAQSRTNVAVGPDFGAIAANRRFGVLVESLGDVPAEIVVERAMYHDAVGQTWAAGTNALATRLR